MSEPVMRMDSVWKRLRRRAEVSTLAELVSGLPKRLTARRDEDGLRDHEFWALRDLSLRLMPGETLGIVGPNGAGKSSVLKLLYRIFRPDRGSVHVNGRVTGLIELGAGFHPMLTGRDNVFINGAILGLKQREIRRKYDSIVEFAELADFMDMPVKNFSSGMYARLAFAVAAHADPALLLVDEVLAVGDASFQNRCHEWIERTRRQGCAIVMVSHQMNVLQSASRVLYLKAGRAVVLGAPEAVIERYLGDQADLTHTAEHSGDDGLPHADLLDADGNVIVESPAHVPVRFRVHVTLREPVKGPVVALDLLHEDPRFRVSTPGANLAQLSSFGTLRDETVVGATSFEVDVAGLHLPVGRYRVAVTVRAHDAFAATIRNENALRFEVVRPSESPSQALIHLEQKWRLCAASAAKAGQ
ncbi:MAG: ATP-binding cassette domain-containing protein [Planctomycetes bacterium]|nr:ATP-binding cassette domain-containing protein [Planctomycetota bacterium]